MSLSSLVTPTTNIIPSANPLRRTKKTHSTPLHIFTKRIAHTSCDLNKQRKEEENQYVTDRRNVLLGLGGLYGYSATQSMSAMGAPIQPPDISTCHTAEDAVTKKPVSCCPPYSMANIVDFIPPSQNETFRVRKPAHKLSKEEIDKFNEAVAKMKALPSDDPWNFYQQATIHCTYCNGAFDQVGTNPPVLLQLHGSWLFFPWHRYYLHFWEKILGKLIDDPTFAIPYWNWDAPDGMYIPKIYLDESSPLYNDNRDKNHYLALFDYKYAFGDPNPSTSAEIEEVVTRNLCQLEKMYKESSSNPSLFMGKPLRAGETATTIAAGTLENLHNVIHQWTGSPTSPYYDMGNFVTVARDALFYAQHANVDRMWDLYSSFRGYKPEFKDPDWLESSFIFYDENRQVVKVKVKDCLKTEQLRFTYSPEDIPWKDMGGRCKEVKSATKKSADKSAQPDVSVSEFGSKPISLTKTIRVIVPRPKTSRSKAEKEEAKEVLLIDGIKVTEGNTARFDVYVTKATKDGQVGPDKGELAGSFVKVPHSHSKEYNKGPKVCLELGITCLVEDIEAEASDKLVVTLVPRMGEIVVGGVHVDLFKVED